jgi:hypothetical protein
MGRELFDYAFKQYATRWAFKHPTPADFFRTMEDASGEDLDWFWRGWFYSTDVCDISIDSVKYAKTDATGEVTVQGRSSRRSRNENTSSDGMQSLPGPQGSTFDDVSKIRNREDRNIKFATDADTSLRDFYWRYNRGLEFYDSSAKFPSTPQQSLDSLSAEEKKKYSNKYFYELSFGNKGGLTMPIILEWTYKDGTKEIDRIPAQVWRLNENKVVKTFMKNKEVISIKLDPMKETADIDESNNTWGSASQQPTKLQVFKMKQQARGQSNGPNPMQNAQQKKKDF